MKPSNKKMSGNNNNSPFSDQKACPFAATCSQLADEKLIEQIKQDPECFGCLTERYERKISAYIRRITGASEETIKDITQEVFIKVYLNIDKFDPSLKFSSWIYRIAHNEAVNRFVYEKRRPTESLTWHDTGRLKNEIIDHHDISKEIHQEFIQQKLQGALQNVPPKYQQVIQLNYFQEKSYQEIADELEKPINTVGTLLNRAKKALKEEMLQLGLSYEVLA